ncbi:predicted protein [Paecilomyces variotii No. 5]|uniref:N-acetyltransferase domain-containing protein n=1 Tax=Byssochlamys spectabilis (strain No. 5 / NBRC 109023) TaxID=1356009 RepID=V5G5I8_BYSSN|nr:predicted protein [Paecilomyces variotii No. 5]
MANTDLLTAVHVAERNEYAEAIHLHRQAEICQRLFSDRNVLILPIAGGTAIRTLSSFSWKLNRIAGLGMRRHVLLEKDLRDVQSTFASLDLYPQIHLCPLSDPSALRVLSSCGYTVSAFVNVYVCFLDDSSRVGRIDDYRNRDSGATDVVISKAMTDQAETFIQASIAGFRDNGRSPELLGVLAQIASLREDTHLYFAKIGDQIVGTAALAVMNTPHGEVAHLYLDSTAAEYRGKGVHRAMIEARLFDAKQLGVGFASLATTPGSGSARNAEKAGFSLAYTKAIFTKQYGS